MLPVTKIADRLLDAEIDKPLSLLKILLESMSVIGIAVKRLASKYSSSKQVTDICSSQPQSSIDTITG